MGFSHFLLATSRNRGPKKHSLLWENRVQWGSGETENQILNTVVDCSSTVGFGCLSIAPSRMDRRTGDPKSAGQWYSVLTANSFLCIETVAQSRYEPQSSWHYMMKLSLDTVYNGMNAMAVSRSLICFTF